MPYPSEHSARLRDPKDFDKNSFRRTEGGTIHGNIKVPKTIGIIWGKLKGKSKPSDYPLPQALRFPIKHWTVEKAKKWLKDNNIKPISFEPASGEKKENKKSEDIPKAALTFKEEDVGVKIEQFSDGDGKIRRRFKMIANSGGIISNHWLWGNFAIDLEGVSIGRQKKPTLREHNADRIVGWTEKIEIVDKGIIAEGYFSEKTEDGRLALELANEGFPWQASIYIPPLTIERIEAGAEAEVNGRKLKGPGTIFRKSRLREVSFCSLGADENTSVRAFKDGKDIINIEFTEKKNRTEREEVKTMEGLTELTLDTLKSERDDLVEILLKEGQELGKKQERERILSIFKEAKAFSGMNELANELVQNGASIAEAISQFKDKRLKELEAKAPKTTGPGADPENERSNDNLSLEEKVDKEWDKDPKLREEFSSKEEYFAFKKAEAEDRVKILKK